MSSVKRIMLLVFTILTLGACTIHIDPGTGQVIIVSHDGSKTCIGQVCEETYISEARVVLQPQPPLGFILDGWSLCLQTDNSACVLDYGAAAVRNFWFKSFDVNPLFRPYTAAEVRGFYEGTTTFRGITYTIGCLVYHNNFAQCFGRGATNANSKIALIFNNLTPNGSGGFGEINGYVIRSSAVGSAATSTDTGEAVHLLNHNITPGVSMGVNYRADSDNADGSFSVAINPNYNIGLGLNLAVGEFVFVVDKNGAASGTLNIMQGGALSVSQNGCTDTGSISVTANTKYTSTYRVVLDGNCASTPFGPGRTGTAVVLSTQEDADAQLVIVEDTQGMPIERPSYVTLKIKP